MGISAKSRWENVRTIANERKEKYVEKKSAQYVGGMPYDYEVLERKSMS